MHNKLPYLNVFLSSPGDVPEERALARKIMKRLPNRYTFRGRVALNVIAWDDPDSTTAMEATLSPQEAINRGLPRPSESDIVIVIFWSRMGTPFTDNDGTRYESGSHWELMDALRSSKTRTYIYRRTEDPDFGSINAPDYEDRVAQYQRLDQFFKSSLFYKGDEIQRSVHTYTTPSEFERMFEYQFEEIVSRILDEISDRQPTFKPVEAAQVETMKSEAWSPDKSPFPGLRAFTQEDAAIFYGRSVETDLLVKRLAKSRFVAVAGASGSGKSSLVGAGLLPRLQANAISNKQTGSKDWLLAIFTPGLSDNPFESLAIALIDNIPALHCDDPIDYPDRLDRLTENLQKSPQNLRKIVAHALRSEHKWSELLIFIDQFEELFTLTDASYSQSFAAMLSDAVAGGDVTQNTRIRIVVTLRADFYHEAVEIPILSQLLVDGSFPLSTPSQERLMEMITRPAERAAMVWEEGLPERILADTGTETGNLALMAYALDELYKLTITRADGYMTVADYERLGGVRGAIGARAEDVFKATGVSEDTLLRAFQRLVDVDKSGTATRRRMRVLPDELSEDATKLIEAFVSARLLVKDFDTVRNQITIEVAHEAIFREWHRLVHWIEESQEDIFNWRQLLEAVENWLYYDQQQAFLWSPDRVKMAITSIKHLDVKPTQDVQDFLRLALTPQETPDFIAPPDAEHLLRELEQPDIPPYRRHWIGLWISHLGDPRPGTGVTADGTPDIAWHTIDAGEVTLDTPNQETMQVDSFQISRYPVTNAQFQVFIDAEDGARLADWWEGLVPLDSPQRDIRAPWFEYESAPRESVTWIQAVAFTRWLTARYERSGQLPAGKIIRLPVEWEWQMAASGGDPALVYPYGNTFDETRANTSDLNFNMTSVVGIFLEGKSPTGLYDMSGNVWEWCLNGFYDPPITDMDVRIQRTLRGGAWFSPRDQATIAQRYKTNTDDFFYYIGFRICLADPL